MQKVGITETTDQPAPNTDEFDRSTEIILNGNTALAKAYRKKSVSFYRPMPPLDFSQTANGKVQRTVTIGIHPVNEAVKNEIVGINMISRKVVHYASGAPPHSLVSSTEYGVDNAQQKTTNRVSGDTFQLTIKKQRKVL